MNHYQNYLNELFKEYRPKPTYPTYPPYHSGEYLEDYFYSKFISSDIDSKIYYIPVSWTTIYIENLSQNLQSKLDSLDNSKNYFIVSQHDDAPKEKLPKNCLVFAAGGNNINDLTVPIPLICSQIPGQIKIKNPTKKYLASFVGSITHHIRYILCEYYKNNKNFLISTKNWTPKVSENNLNDFIRISQESYFTFCPRGYGLNSFRLYESFQLDSVPIILSDNLYLPMTEIIDWNSISVIPKNISEIETKLNYIIDNNYEEYLERGKKAYNEYFTLDKLYTYIIQRIQTYEKNTITSC